MLFPTLDLDFSVAPLLRVILTAVFGLLRYPLIILGSSIWWTGVIERGFW